MCFTLSMFYIILLLFLAVFGKKKKENIFKSGFLQVVLAVPLLYFLLNFLLLR